MPSKFVMLMHMARVQEAQSVGIKSQHVRTSWLSMCLSLWLPLNSNVLIPGSDLLGLGLLSIIQSDPIILFVTKFSLSQLSLINCPSHCCDTWYHSCCISSYHFCCHSWCHFSVHNISSTPCPDWGPPLLSFKTQLVTPPTSSSLPVPPHITLTIT